jgi:hypothetical protein
MAHHGRMTENKRQASKALAVAFQDEEAATEAETRATLLERSNRTFTPVSKAFVQNPDKRAATREGPLAEFVRNGDKRGLNALLFATAITSNGDSDHGWSTTLPLSVWARVLNATTTAELTSANNATTKILGRLQARGLITRERVGRSRGVRVTLLAQDGSRRDYTRPSGKSETDRFLKLDHKYWTEDWFERLQLPGIAMLLVALHEPPLFELPTEKMRAWYGFSPDTAERGFSELRDAGLVTWFSRTKKEPLAPTGKTIINVYELQGAFTREDAATPAEVLDAVVSDGPLRSRPAAVRKAGAKP